MKAYPHIFTPIDLGGVEIKNRIYMPPMATRYSHSSIRYVDYFKERARNGVGLIFTGHVKAEKTIDPYQIGYPTLDTKADMKYFTELTEAVHQYGAKIAVQLSAGTGRLANGVRPGDHPASASEVQMMYHPDMKTRALTKDEIHRLVEAYGVAAGNAKDAGFDFVYVHGLAFLIDQFLSPVWNHRTDEYGGPIENRMRFMMECIDSARSHVGDKFPLLAGFSMNEGMPGGKTEEDCFVLAKALEKKGIVGLHMRNGVYETTHLRITSNMCPTQSAVERASRIREQVSIPVLTDGSLLDPDTCEQLLAEGKVDMTGIGRPLLADPEWVRKAAKGRAEDIRPCLRCNECINRVRSGVYIGCSVNPLLHRERDAVRGKAEEKKKVLVIGGGQSGMLTALYAAGRGHDVTIAERKKELGGHMLEGSAAPFKKETKAYLSWILRQLKKENVDIQTGVTVDEDYIRRMAPDAAVLCSGSVPNVPDVPGIDKPHVKYAVNVLLDDSGVKDDVIIVGSGLVGCETAVDLAMKGKQVTITDMIPEIGKDIIQLAKIPMLEEMEKQGIVKRPGLRLTEVTDDGITCTDAEGKDHFLKGGTVIIAAGLKAEDSLYHELLGLVPEVHKVGDCIRARKFIDAGREAYAIASVL